MEKTPIEPIRRPDRLQSYFLRERPVLTLVTVSGILYNIGMTAGPYFEGQLAQRLYDVTRGRKTLRDMLSLAVVYLAVILFVQVMRCVKRFYVRRFANNTARNMRHMLYNSLVHTPKPELDGQSVGAMMTRAISDVDACVEGMRKFTTELFDTGVVMIAYLVLLLHYDWRLTLLACLFTPLAYFIAAKLKTVVTRYAAAYKKSAGQLGDATLDRVSNALTYRIYGLEQARNTAYEARLADYEARAVAANLWENTMEPIYNLIAMSGAVLILWFGGKNVAGTGWTAWNLASFTTFLACFTKLAVKVSHAAKLFNAVQKAQVSWRRIQPMIRDYAELDTATALDFSADFPLSASRLTVAAPDGTPVLRDFSLAAAPGEILGVTGPVACGKSTLGRVLLGELPYGGSLTLGGRELSSLTAFERGNLVTYLGHQPELMSGSIAENILLGKSGDVWPVLRAVRLDAEVAAMPEREQTPVGAGGIRLSGGQQARLALARTLFNAGKILVLDDPFSAVDARTEDEILAALREQCRDKTVFLLSHRLRRFPDLDRVLWLEGGRGVLESHEALMEHCPEYARLYRTQTEGGDLDEP
jgi:ATP-binding cassette subfamily B protein